MEPPISTNPYSRRSVQANILIDRNGNPRIVDFGLAIITRDTNSLDDTSDERSATARFTSPEVLKGIELPSKGSDVFAFGMVMIEVGMLALFRTK